MTLRARTRELARLARVREASRRHLQQTHEPSKAKPSDALHTSKHEQLQHLSKQAPHLYDEQVAQRSSRPTAQTNWMRGKDETLVCSRASLTCVQYAVDSTEPLFSLEPRPDVRVTRLFGARARRSRLSERWRVCVSVSAHTRIARTKRSGAIARESKRAAHFRICRRRNRRRRCSTSSPETENIEIERAQVQFTTTTTTTTTASTTQPL